MISCKSLKKLNSPAPSIGLADLIYRESTIAAVKGPRQSAPFRDFRNSQFTREFHHTTPIYLGNETCRRLHKASTETGRSQNDLAESAVSEALKPFAEPHPMGDAYVKFSVHLIEAARSALSDNGSAGK